MNEHYIWTSVQTQALGHVYILQREATNELIIISLHLAFERLSILI